MPGLSSSVLATSTPWNTSPTAMSATRDSDPAPQLVPVIAARLHRDTRLQRGLHRVQRVELDSARRVQLTHHCGELSGMALVLLRHSAYRPTSTAEHGQRPVVVD